MTPAGSPPEDRKVVLVTGSRTGIGRAVVEHFTAQGAIVEGCSRSEPESPLDGYNHHLVDVTEEAQVRAMLRSISRRHGRLDVLVNNAGIARMSHSLLMATSSAKEVLLTNVLGAFVVSREAVKVMQRRRFGRIISIGSIAPLLKIEGEAMYAASKSALHTFTQVLAKEVAPLGVTCNVIAPTPIRTDLLDGVSDEALGKIVEQLAVKRLSTFNDVINVVEFLASERSDYVTGQIVNLGGV